ncbi:hypothetical protein [Dolichospermum sp. UHCC 0259]|uniref:hypothetical protein n=1 Tax=Dolichospermum sp. UHCC 0259 TaxID=2590010 RepID=UPI001580A131|nr:hypothetical protein [Dolichospermum sp. UHCC 0259]
MKSLNVSINTQINLAERKLGMVVFKFLKYLTFSIMTVSLVIALTNCTSPTASPLLRIGTNLWTGYETLYLARDLGYYDQKPIKL